MAKQGFTLKNIPSILNSKEAKWGLCIGAGTSLPVIPDWYSLIEKIMRINYFIIK